MQTCLIFLSLAFTQIYGQGFQLFFGTTAGVTECKDKLPNCYAFGKDSCKTPYEKWAKDYCAVTCGFCQGVTTPEPPCENNIDDCEKYQKTVCQDTKYKQWAFDNCRYYCRICSPGALAAKDALITTLPPALCVDKLDDCKLYGKSSCVGQYKSWAKENCKRYCGICTGLPTPAPPCRDKIPNCKQYQKSACTSPEYRGWAEDNCNKYCGFCSDGSTSGNQPPTRTPITSAPLIPQLTGAPTPSGTLAPPLPGGRKRSSGVGSSTGVGENILFEKPKQKATPKPTQPPATMAPTTTMAPTQPPTTTPKPTTTEKPKPKNNALAPGSSAKGGEGGVKKIDFSNNSEKTTQAPQSGTTKNGTAAGTGSSAGGKTTAPPNTGTQAATKPPTQGQSGTTAGSGVTGGTGTNKTDAGTGSQPGGGSTASPSGTTSGSGMGGSTAGTGTGTGNGSGTTSGTGTGNGSGSTTGTGGNTGGNTATKNAAVTGSGPNSGSTPASTQRPPASLTPPTNSVTLPDINTKDNFTDYNSTDTECRDLVNCRVYPPEKVCTNGSIYHPWASVRCRAYCGFCILNTSPKPCVNKIPNCNEYDSDLCTNPLYRLFREDNCMKFCNLCSGSSAGRRDSEEVDEVQLY